jgi:hypothetical protein
VDVADLFDAEGYLKPLKDIPEDARRAIAGLEVEEIWGDADDGEGAKGRVVVGRTKKLKLASKVEALKLLGQHLKLFTELREVKVLSLLALFDATEQRAAVS